MNPEELVDALSEPEAYPYALDRIEVEQTHISVVFLAGPVVYKVRKPVRFDFLDFSTLELRRHDCDAEVRLNRRLAPDVYLGVVPIVHSGNRLRLEGKGRVVEWAVKMNRLPREAVLLERLRDDRFDPLRLDDLARKLAEFHRSAARGPEIAAMGRFDVVMRNARDNFAQSREQVGQTIRPAVFERLRDRTEQAAAASRQCIERRADALIPCDTHGDLHLKHVYLFPDRAPPADWVIIDCLEFNDRFRYADPVADMAFLVMDLRFIGREDLAGRFAESYFAASGDAEGRELLPFYAAYRAMVRGKVEGLELAESEIPEREKAEALARARAHWLMALAMLESPERRPCLLLVGGLQGSGKSTLARALGESAGLMVLRSDVVRKELAGADDHIYTEEWTDRTYQECLLRAEQVLLDGNRVVVDATFQKDSRRSRFLELARSLGVPAAFLFCHATPEVVKERLERRKGDASDADWSVYEKSAASWEPPSVANQRRTFPVDTNGIPEEAHARARAVLRQLGLVDGEVAHGEAK